AALAKGLTWRQVVFRHALPNAAIPTVTLVGMREGGLIAGAAVAESTSSWPGVVRGLVTAVASRNHSVVQAILLLVAACMVIASWNDGRGLDCRRGGGGERVFVAGRGPVIGDCGGQSRPFRCPSHFIDCRGQHGDR